ncbi:MAG: choice-of-anchor D domain-containing protein [Bacteroidetes bacterium]|nr:MAG: choice-of-anchor D domain-containing protein [Bacteroidota bacterium]
MIKSILLILLISNVLYNGGLLRSQSFINPSEFEFPQQQTGTSSPAKPFVFLNDSESPVIINPEDISLNGKNALTTNLSVMTYNIEADDGNWPGRFAYILDGLREMDVDIIGFQEIIQRANLDNQAMQIADSLGFYYYFDSVDDESSVQRYGNAIVSRYPILETNYRALEPLNRFRTAIHVKLDVYGNTVDVYNTHLHHRMLDSHIRIIQINDFLDFIEETNNGSYIFITGDFNANPDWEEMQLMYDDFKDVYPIFHENHLDPEHATLNHRVGHQMRRIDYVFFNKASLDDILPLSAEIVLNDVHEDEDMESDHFGVLAHFKLKADDTHFELLKPDQIIELLPGDSIVTEVIFKPHNTGLKEVVLNFAVDSADISGTAFDATITEFPWTEDFQDITDDDLPFGWMAMEGDWQITDTDFAGGQSPELFFGGLSEDESYAMVRTPPLQTQGLDSLTVTFKHSMVENPEYENYSLKLLSIADEQQYIVAQWDNPGNFTSEENTFTIYSENHGVGASMFFLAWHFSGQEDDINYWAIDDIEVNALPALAITPGEFNFGELQVNFQSDSVKFSLTNIGGGFINIQPADIEITGPDNEAFTLYNLSESVILGHSDTAFVYVAFTPQNVGEMSAVLNIAEKNIPLSGKSFDPTITELPWLEDFSAQVQGGVPRGWVSDTRNWETFMLSNAGGTPPEMVFWWEPEKTGRFYLKTPEIITHDLDTLLLSFKYRVRNFQQPGIYTLSVIAIADGQEYIINEWVDPDFIASTEFLGIIDSENHGLGAESFRLAWVFDGATNNIVSWDFDDILLEEPPNEPVPFVSPDSNDFGAHPLNSTTDPVGFTLYNRGKAKWIINPDDINITGEDASQFILQTPSETIELGLLESETVLVSFSPDSPGLKNATLQIGDDINVSLSGWGNDPGDYFIYSDFSIPGFTNVEGFREIPGWAQGLTATDLSNQGEFGGTVLQLEYDLDVVNDFTSYWLWAFPSANISGHDEMVIYIKADEPISDVRIQMFDTDGIQGTDGASYTYIDIDTDWQGVNLPVEDFLTMDWANNLPDMSKIQRIDITFEKGSTVPSQNKVYIDLVGFISQVSSETNLSHSLSFQMFPNPASQKVTLFSPEKVTISIFDINGKELLTKKSQQEQTILDISGLKSGIYMVRIQNYLGTMVKKLSVL